ncbi:MAG: hypothetical protein WC087_04210 [Candidatus Paceibacterota bacterium]
MAAAIGLVVLFSVIRQVFILWDEKKRRHELNTDFNPVSGIIVLVAACYPVYKLLEYSLYLKSNSSFPDEIQKLIDRIP